MYKINLQRCFLKHEERFNSRLSKIGKLFEQYLTAHEVGKTTFQKFGLKWSIKGVYISDPLSPNVELVKWIELEPVEKHDAGMSYIYEFLKHQGYEPHYKELRGCRSYLTYQNVFICETII